MTDIKPKQKMIKVELEIKAIVWEDGKGTKQFYHTDDVLYRSIDDTSDVQNKLQTIKLPTLVAKEIRSALDVVKLAKLEKEYLERVIKDLEFNSGSEKVEFQKKLDVINFLLGES